MTHMEMWLVCAPFVVLEVLYCWECGMLLSYRAWNDAVLVRNVRRGR